MALYIETMTELLKVCGKTKGTAKSKLENSEKLHRVLNV